MIFGILRAIAHVVAAAVCLIVVYSWTAGFVVMLYRRKRSYPVGRQPQVSIIRPLKGFDPDLYKTLESSFTQEYPCFEIIFTVSDPKDPSIPVVRALMKNYPTTSFKSKADSYTGNPKIVNMAKGFAAAKYDLVWVVDSNVITHPLTLAHAASIFSSDPKIGLVHQIPCGAYSTGFGGLLDSLYMTCTHARVYNVFNHFASYFGLSVVMGKSNMYRKSDLNSTGGIEQFSKFIAEDNEIGKAIIKAGRSHQISPDLAYQCAGNMSLKEFAIRRIRWIRVRKFATPVSTLIEPLSFSFIHSGLMAYFLSAYLDVAPLTLYAASMLCWLLNDIALMYLAHTQYKSNFSYGYMLKLVLAWPLAELILPMLWVVAVFFGNTIQWRGATYRCRVDGTAVVVKKAF